MANQKHPENFSGDYNPYRPTGHWTDGFPHSFHGWGPQTPLPDNELPEGAGHVKLKVRDELTWRPDDVSGHDHIIWRYDTRH